MRNGIDEKTTKMATNDCRAMDKNLRLLEVLKHDKMQETFLKFLRSWTWMLNHILKYKLLVYISGKFQGNKIGAVRKYFIF